MDSPQPSKKNHSGSSSPSALNNLNSNYSLMESSQGQESLFPRFAETLSPLTNKASRVGQGFQGLNSPPLVFKSPRTSRRKTLFVGRPQGTQSLGGEISQSENGGNCLGEAPADSWKLNSQQPLLGGSITDTQQDFDSKNDEITQNYCSSLSIEQYFADFAYIDQMYSAVQIVEQSTDAAEPSMSDPTQSKKNILTSDRKDGPGNKAEDYLPLSDDSNRIHQEKPAYSEEPEKMKAEKNDFDWGCRDPTNLDSNLAANIFEKQYTHDQLPQDVKGCKDFSELVSTLHVTSENILQDGSKVLNDHVNARRCLQFGEAAFKAFISNKPHVKEETTSSKMKMTKLSEPVSEPPGMTQPSTLYSASTHDKRKLNPTDAGNFKQIIQPPSESKKKKKTSATADGNDCKVCNCKNSKCLKLYCECFTRGSFCTDSCTCYGCLNRLEHADIVWETKQQIKSRDPTAFTPKIVQLNTDNKEDTDLTTPPSSRHKRGCNCKKSMCQKKYCECYQANVRCSSACRCEGCKNVGGNEKDFVASKQDALSKERVSSVDEKAFSDSSFDRKLEIVASQMTSHHLSITPSLQCSDPVKEAATTRAISENLAESSEYLRSSRSFLETNEMLRTTFNHENLYGYSPFSFRINEWKDVSQPQLSHGYIPQTPDSFFHWRSSQSDFGVHDMAENKTPYIVQEVSAPLSIIKVNSPTQKRVISPQIRYNGIESSSSGGLSSGRKFMPYTVPSFPPLYPHVDSVPSFPPLHPHVNFKGNGNEEDLGNNSESK